MVQLVHQLLSPNRHPQTPGVGEVRQPPSPRLVLLSENDLARRPVLRLPAPNPSLQRPPNPRMTPHHLFVQRHRPQPRVRLQQRHDLLVEYPRQRVGASPPPRLLHRPTPRIPFDPIRRRPAEPRLRRRQRRPVLPSSGHVQLHLVVRNPSARHFASLLIPGKHQSSNLPPPPPAVSPCLSQASHPDCRATEYRLNLALQGGKEMNGPSSSQSASMSRQRVSRTSSCPHTVRGCLFAMIKSFAECSSTAARSAGRFAIRRSRVTMLSPRCATTGIQSMSLVCVSVIGHGARIRLRTSPPGSPG